MAQYRLLQSFMYNPKMVYKPNSFNNPNEIVPQPTFLYSPVKHEHLTKYKELIKEAEKKVEEQIEEIKEEGEKKGVPLEEVKEIIEEVKDKAEEDIDKLIEEEEEIEKEKDEEEIAKEEEKKEEVEEIIEKEEGEEGLSKKLEDAIENIDDQEEVDEINKIKKHNYGFSTNPAVVELPVIAGESNIAELPSNEVWESITGDGGDTHVVEKKVDPDEYEEMAPINTAGF